MKRAWAFLLFALLPGCGTVGHELRHVVGSREAKLAADAVIERDAFGVPSVTGRTPAAAAFGAAYAQAEDHYVDIEDGYIRALGWAAHYWGERYLADDLARLALGTNRQAHEAFAAADPGAQQVWAGFAAGLNHYLRTHPEAPRKLIMRYEPWMIFARAMPSALDAPAAEVRLREIGTLVGERNAGAFPDDAAGSGSLAIGVPSTRSASGHALLLSAPDAPFFGPDQPYAQRLASADGWQAGGLTRLGLPLPESGHNAHVAWSVAPSAAVAVQPVWFDRTDTLRYRSESGVGRGELVRDSLRLNTANGVVWRSYTFVRTPLGVVFARRGDTAYVARLTQQGGGLLPALYLLSKVTSLPQLPGSLTRDTAGPPLRAAVDDAGNAIGAGAAGDSAWSSAALRALLFEGRAAGAADELAALVYEWEQVGGTQPRRAFAQDSSIELLRRWDARMDTTAVAATLYERWQRQLAQGGYAGEFMRFRALEDATSALRREWGREHVAWGELNRLQRASGARFRDDAASRALPGGPPHVRSPLVSRSVGAGGGRRYAVSGTAAVLLVELSQPPASSSVLVFGASGDSASAHWFDQAAGFVRGELNPLTGGAVRERYQPGKRARAAAGETAGTRQP